jgi:hypothetical protein
MLIYSKLISETLVNHPGLYKQYKELAIFNVGGHFKKCQMFYDSLNKNGLIEADMCWGSCFRGLEQNLVFIGDEATILHELGSIQERRLNPTPAKVMAKMFALRLQRIYDGINDINAGILTNNAYRLSAFSAGTIQNFQPIPLIDQITPDDIKDRFVRLNAHYGLITLVRGANIFLDRSDITDEIIERGLNMHFVREIMTE